MMNNRPPFAFTGVGSPRYVQKRLGKPQYRMILGLWAMAAVITLIINWHLPLEGREGLLFFTLLAGISIMFNVRLPSGGNGGLVDTAICAAALVIGFRQAALTALIVTVLSVPLGYLILNIIPRLRRYRRDVAVDLLRHNTTIILSVIPAGWLYERLVIHGSDIVTIQGQIWPLVVFGFTYFIISTLILSFWLLLDGMSHVKYFARFWLLIVMSTLFGPLILSLILSLGYVLPEIVRVVGYVPYIIGALFFNRLLYTQLHLLDRVDDLHTLNNITQALNKTLEFDDLLATLHDEISLLLDTSGFYLALYDEDTSTLSFELLYAKGEPLPPSTRPFANGLTEHIVRTRKTLLIPRDIPGFAARHYLNIEAFGASVLSFLGVPVMVGEEVIGVMALRNYSEVFAYNEDDQRLLEIIARATAVALQNAQLYQQSRRQSAELSALNLVSSLISAGLDTDVVGETICNLVIRVMACQKASLFLLDPDKNTVRIAYSIGISQEFVDNSQNIDVQHSPRALSIRRRMVVVTEDIAEDRRFQEELELYRNEGFQSVIEVPLVLGDEVIGSLTAYYDEPRHFPPSDINLMHTLAGQLAVTFDNARLFEITNSHRRELETLYITGRVINSSLSIDNVLRAVAANMTEIFETSLCAILLVDESQKNLVPRLCLLVEDDIANEREVEETAFPLDQLPEIAEAVRNLEILPLEESDCEKESILHRMISRCCMQSGVGIPLTLHGEMVGLILLGQPVGTFELDPENVHLAGALADQAAMAIQNARLFQRTDEALARRLEELSAIQAVSQRMARRLNLQTVIDQVITAAIDSTAGDYVELLLYDAAEDTLTSAARKGNSERFADLERWSASEGLTGRAAKTRLPVLVNNVLADDDYLNSHLGTLSELAVPIVLDDECLGVINLESTLANAFDADQERFITSLAEHAAIAIQNARLFETLQKRAEDFRTLRAVAVDMLASTDMYHTLKVIARQALDHTGAIDVHIYLYDEQTQRLTFGTSLWHDGEVDKEFSTPRPDGLTMTVARSGEHLVITDTTNHPLLQDVANNPAWRSMKAMLGFPLKSAGEVIGVFNMALSESQSITEETLHYLDLLATQAAAAVAKARLTEEIRASRDRLQAILNSINDGILMFDMKGYLLMANRRVEELLGQPVTNYVNRHFLHILKELSAIMPDETFFSPRKGVAIARSVRNNPEQIATREYTIETLSSPQVVSETSLPVFGYDDEVLGRLYILRDVSHEREVELYRQEVSNMIVHDLRSPLSGIITGLYIAMAETAELKDREGISTLESTLEVSLNSAEAMLRLVEQILDVNKLEANEVPLILEPVNLPAMAQQAYEKLTSTASASQIEVTISAPDKIPAIPADADKIERVIINLLDNALRFTPQGGQVSIEITADGDIQQFCITDTGDGVPAEIRERIFERFFQGAPHLRKRGPRGSGLGLTFCQLVIQAHNGRIWVDDGPEGGAAFHFTLPTAVE
jgi:NtrC-family two-component system sensor histidine kinase KinB